MYKGILVIDKEKGKTSRDIVNDIVHKFNIRRVGHTGTLDPLATGVLVVAVGEACKIIELLTASDKEYIAEVLVGKETDTLDITGNVLKEEKRVLAREKLEEVLNSFLGEYEQEVPIYSAVHVDGKRLYEYARNNESVHLPKRKVCIKEIELLDVFECSEYQHFTFRVSVSKGCYIRSLIRDIGLKLSCPLTMANLRRTRQGIFRIETSKKVSDITDNDFISISDSLDIPKVVIDNPLLLKKISNGMKLEKSIDEMTCFTDNHGEVVAIYYPDNEIMRALKVFPRNTL